MMPSESIETPKTVMEKVGPNIISHVSNTYKTDYPPIIKIEPISSFGSLNVSNAAAVGLYSITAV